ncbi:MAG: transporter [Litorimonas sp.]
MKAISIALALIAAITPYAHAQNTGGIFSPIVNEGHRSLQYRATFSDDDRSAQRVHYQDAINDDFMWRVVGQVISDGNNTDFDFLQGEMFWDLSDKNDKWAQGLRFDIRVRDDNRPNQFGLNWANEFKLSDRLQARALVFSTLQFGDNSANGIFLQTRGSLTYKATDKVNVGVESYNNYGSTNDFQFLKDSQQQIGPFVTFPVHKNTSIFLNALFGVSQSAPDTDLRFWVTQSF